LKRGFSAYSPEDNKQVLLKGGATPKADEPRNRRLDADEEERILAVLADRLWWSSKFGHYDRFFCCHFPFVDGGRHIAQN
jgi:hypothetical protein